MAKILTICEGGNVRSVTLARVIKDNGHESIAASWKHLEPATLQMLLDWCDQAVFLDHPDNFQNLKAKAPGYQVLEDTLFIDLKEDRWHRAHHPELLKICRNKFQNHVKPLINT